MAYLGEKPSQTLASPTSQYFNGDGSTVAFTLNRAVNVAEDLDVFVNNVRQEPGVGKSYTAIGTTLTFDAAPSAGTDNVYVVYRGLAEVTTRLEHPSNSPIAATNGTFSGAISATTGTFSGAVSGTTGTFSGAVSAASATVTGDLTVDTNTLYVDSTNNRVGIRTTSPQDVLDLGDGTAGAGIVWGGPTGTAHYGSIWSEYGTASIVIGAGLKGSTSSSDFIFPFTGTYGYAAIELDSFSNEGIKFYTGGSVSRTSGASATKNERMRIDSDGLKFNGDTAAANALDDYEEGTHNVTDLSGAGLTFTTNRSFYVKTGSIVNYQASINVPSNSNGNSLQLSLPFGSNIGGYFAGTGVVGYSTVSSSSYPDLSPMVNNNGSNIIFYWGNGNSFSNADASGHRIDFWVQYQRT